MVADGIYRGDIAVTNSVTILSVNGPQYALIDGGGTNRCVLLVDGASLTGFTLTNGYCFSSVGAGVLCRSTNAFLTNCIIVGNSAVVGPTGWGSSVGAGGGVAGGKLYNCILRDNWAIGAGWFASYGGGATGSVLYNCTLTGNLAYNGGAASYSTLYNCVLSSNRSDAYGGGAFDSTLDNCTLIGNSALSGGGAYAGTLNNCVIYFNTATNGANYLQDEYSHLDYCCTTPMPTNGIGNITNVPQFVDYTRGNLRLQSASPCINSGNNTYVSTGGDLDGNPRIVSRIVDIGAYEYQGAGSIISYAWLQQYGLPTDGSADYTDPDQEGMNNWQEWRCLTCPTDAQSALRLLPPVLTGTNTTVAWESVAGVSYFLERSTNLGSSFLLLATNILGQTGTTSCSDTNATSSRSLFYRVGVQAP
jgi:hypothetical protein